jgi:hypothetical protein
MSGYRERFPTGSRVRVALIGALETFRRAWRFHHPLTDQQIEYAGTVATVKDVGFYHGGDVLYVLDGVPGIWHEVCLLAPPSDDVAG